MIWDNPIIRIINMIMGIMFILFGIAGILAGLYIALGIITIPISIVIMVVAGLSFFAGLAFLMAGKVGASPMKMFNDMVDAGNARRVRHKI